MDFGLKNKVALITGGSEGIGAATAEILAEEGAKVAICSRTLTNQEELRRRIRKNLGVEIEICPADFSNPEDIKNFINSMAEKLGGVDILVNSVGSSMFGSFDQIPDEAWVKDINLKLLGTVRACRAVLPHMRKMGGGRIINVAGNSGKQPYNWHFPGGAANAALLNFTHALSQEVIKDKILVTAVCPGPVETRRLQKQLKSLSEIWNMPLEQSKKSFYDDCPLKRAATPEEVGNLIAFLASTKASYIAGTAVTIDGGITECI
jgi:NAD(P)-dependent dehydrogenase (short-subunit alcohol dehydrogenase family)